MRSYLSSFHKAFLLLLIIPILVSCASPGAEKRFDGDRAYQHVLDQVAFGPRVPGTSAHQKTIEYIASTLQQNGWNVTYHITSTKAKAIKNILATRADDPSVLIGAHYDSREFADQDPNPKKALLPVPGANDGASGVAILLELSRSLPIGIDNVGLVFFDQEDQGGINGSDWILGSRAFVSDLKYEPEGVIILDMVGQVDAKFFYEYNSDVQLSEEIWETAESLNNDDYFIREYKFSILDDHTPFVENNIPAIDVIDFDYPHWHTSADTPDKLSPKTLSIVGSTIYTWLLNRSGIPKER